MQTSALIQSELSAQLKSPLRIGLLIAGHESILIQGGQRVRQDTSVFTGECYTDRDDKLAN